MPRIIGIMSFLLVVAVTSGACHKYSTAPRNHYPTMSSLTVAPPEIGPADSAVVTCIASDPDGDTLVYDWDTDLRLRIKGNDPGDPTKSNTFNNSETFYPDANYHPTRLDSVAIVVTARDGRGGAVARPIYLLVHP